MLGVDPRTFRLAISQIQDGMIFEEFANSFLSAVLGYQFIPVGGTKDRGIDGLQYLYHREKYNRRIFQSSIEKNAKSKIIRTLKTLSDNGLSCEVFTYVTNQRVRNLDVIIDEVYDLFNINIRIYDSEWFAVRVNESGATINAYSTFVDSYLHEFRRPEKEFYVANLVGDPTLYVYLKQQWTENKDKLKLNQILADTLILFALEGTDPDENKFRTRNEINEVISKHIKYDIKLLDDVVSERLVYLAKKPNNKINFHKNISGYCLPYETRLQLKEKQMSNLALYNAFREQTSVILVRHLSSSSISVHNPIKLIDQTINKLFYDQGLEFADFINHGETRGTFEQDLPDLISRVVEDSSVISKNKEPVKNALLTTIRAIVYNGTVEQKEFLKSLSNTYMMLFLLQCEPKVATYFKSLASKLNVYVGNSIIVPALSEYYLEPRNRRQSNLLKGSHRAGVKMFVNESIIKELVGHFRKIVKVFNTEYKEYEEIYLENEQTVEYVPEILIRAYFYARQRGQVNTFDEYIETFLSLSFYDAEASMSEWLKHEFGIKFQHSDSLDLNLNNNEINKLTEALTPVRANKLTARNDAQLILTVFGLRKLNNEIGTGSIFGYRTWWLSKDMQTQRKVNEVFDKYQVSCYLRPDFLRNYISLAPSRQEVDKLYDDMFPSLVGVNISARLPNAVVKCVNSYIHEYAKKNPARVKASLREMGEKLKIDPSSVDSGYLRAFGKNRNR